MTNLDAAIALEALMHDDLDDSEIDWALDALLRVRPPKP